jgi:anti-sigma factor RsiW
MDGSAMQPEDSHLSDQELVLAADGELPPGRDAQIREHLAGCPACRSRMAALENASTDFARLHFGNPDLPPVAPARALLKAQLAAEFAATSAGNEWRRRVYAAAAFLVAALGIVMLHEGRPAETVALPKASLTPGATVPVTRDDVCLAEPPEDARLIPVSVQRRVFEEYGIANREPRAYEVDHLITPALGGSDDIRNLWPQSYSAPVWNAHVKDALENRLHQLVCDGKLDLSMAQRDISSDWIAAYKKYFHTDKPVSQ